MKMRDRLIYGAVVAFVVFFLGEYVFGAGTLTINIVFAVAVGIFAVIAVSIAAKVSNRNK
ncbi:MAG: hypothetical protein AAGD13_16470 [Pseudomonadota bacterium]